MYRASNGIISGIVTEDEAREHYSAADVVVGHFGGRFVTAVLARNGWGLQIAAAITTYEPVDAAAVGELDGAAA